MCVCVSHTLFQRAFLILFLCTLAGGSSRDQSLLPTKTLWYPWWCTVWSTVCTCSFQVTWWSTSFSVSVCFSCLEKLLLHPQSYCIRTTASNSNCLKPGVNQLSFFWFCAVTCSWPSISVSGILFLCLKKHDLWQVIETVTSGTLYNKRQVKKHHVFVTYQVCVCVFLLCLLVLFYMLAVSLADWNMVQSNVMQHLLFQVFGAWTYFAPTFSATTSHNIPLLKTPIPWRCCQGESTVWVPANHEGTLGGPEVFFRRNKSAKRLNQAESESRNPIRSGHGGFMVLFVCNI